MGANRFSGVFLEKATAAPSGIHIFPMYYCTSAIVHARQTRQDELICKNMIHEEIKKIVTEAINKEEADLKENIAKPERDLSVAKRSLEELSDSVNSPKRTDLERKELLLAQRTVEIKTKLLTDLKVKFLSDASLGPIREKTDWSTRN